MKANRKGFVTEIKSKRLQTGSQTIMYRLIIMIIIISVIIKIIMKKNRKDRIMTSTIHDDSNKIVKRMDGFMVENRLKC